MKFGKIVLCSILSAQLLFSGVQVFAADNSQVKTQVKTSSISRLSDEELKNVNFWEYIKRTGHSGYNDLRVKS